MRFWRRRYKDHELAPDEIFLDATNLPDFNQGTLEGRLERPISHSTYVGIFAVIVLIFSSLIAQAANLELVQGAKYAQRSENNRLRPEVLFAQRGAILDRNGVPLVSNIESEGGVLKRTYRSPGFAHLLGYVSYPKKDSAGRYYDTEVKGLAGVEAAFNDRLAGKNGTLLVEEDARGNIQSQGSVLPAEHGTSLELSIDARAQQAMYDSLKELADRIPYQGGAGVLMNVRTGEILALVSYPEYDPNILSQGTPADIIASYNRDSRLPYLDRPVSGLYTPGSIVKPMEAAAAITDGIVSPETVIVSNGYISIPNPYDPSKPNIFKDWKAHGPQDLRAAIAYSSDVYFYSIGGGFGPVKGLGIERLAHWYRAFGFESKTGIELAGEKAGFVPTPAWKEKTYNEKWNIGNTYHTAIGQYAMQMTPLEAVRATAAIANGGTLVRPTVLKDPQRSSSEKVPATQEALRVAREGMRQGVTEGTSVGLNSLPFVRAAGKTGTAQLGLRNEFYNSWSIGFFPYEHPEYAWVVVMEKGPAGTAIGGTYVMHQFFTRFHAAAPEFFQ